MNSAFRQVVSRGVSSAAFAAAAEEAGEELPDWARDPQKIAYLRFLIEEIYRGRRVVASYNLIVIVVIFSLAALQWREKARDRRRWRARAAEPEPGLSENKLDSEGGGGRRSGRGSGDNEEWSSSSSSTLREGDVTPPGPKQVDIDLESRPLLPRSRAARGPAQSRLFCLPWKIKGWLAYQPRPLPIVSRQLPTNGTSLFVLAFVGLNAFFHFYKLPLGAKYFFLFADRSGYVFIANLPLLYLLAAKTQPLKVLTGRSYEALNIFHRRLGEFMCFEALVHMMSMIVWRLCLEPDWLLSGGTVKEYFFHPLILEGFGAFLSYELLYFTSLSSFRQRWYELFLASHVVLQVVALVFLWLHFATSRPYVSASLAIFLLDRLIWRLSLKSMSTIADLTILPDGETFLLSADWDIPSQPPSTLSRFLTHNIRSGWRPTDHVFLTVPSLGTSHALQAHPFTIASAAPPIPSWTTESSPPRRPVHAWLNLLIRAHSGFTSNLLSHARSQHSSVPVRLDGPYGSSHALDMLRASDTAVLVAGGSGIAVVYPLAEALLLHPGQPSGLTIGRRRQRVRLLWVVHSREHREWIPAERLTELEAAGLELVVPAPTAEAGRPDVAGLVEGWIAEAAGGECREEEVGVVVSGPDGMNRDVNNVYAAAIGRGRAVRVGVEKFGW
jgi:NAD(P)H-flavin reductase